MDPNAAAEIMRDETADKDDRQQAAFALRTWLAGGGFPQRVFDSTGKVRTFGGNTAARLAAQNEVDSYIKQFGEAAA